jgi:SAM-dependent methyltransferase
MSGRKNVDGMRDYWNEKAKTNAAWYVDTSLDFDNPDMQKFFESGKAIAAKALDDSPVQPARHGLAVEIGSGLGRICLALKERFDEVVGFDISPEMVRRAGEMVSAEGVRFQVGDGASLQPLPDGAADLVVSFTVFQHIPDPAVIDAYIAEAGRVLAPGGLFAFQWNNQASPRTWRVRRWLMRFRREPHDRHDPAFMGTTVTQAHIRASLEGAGLRVAAMQGEGTLFAWCWATKPGP